MFETMLGLPASGFVPVLLLMLSLGRGLLIWLLLVSALFWPLLFGSIVAGTMIALFRPRRRNADKLSDHAMVLR